MPFLGTMAGPMRTVAKDVAAAHPLGSRAAWRDTCLALWREATYREERYTAIELTGHRLYRDHQTPEALADVRGVHRRRRVVGLRRRRCHRTASARCCASSPTRSSRSCGRGRPTTTCGDVARRSSVRSARRPQIDLGLLYDCIEPNMADTGVLHSQGHRLGAALARLAESGRDPALRGRECRPTVRAIET